MMSNPPPLHAGVARRGGLEEDECKGELDHKGLEHLFQFNFSYVYYGCILSVFQYYLIICYFILMHNHLYSVFVCPPGRAR